MSMNVVPSVVTTELLLVYSSGLLIPYQSLLLPADVLGMPWDLFMFVHHQVYSGHCFCYFLCLWGKAVPNQWSQFLYWARFHGLWWYLDGTTVSQMPQKGPESPWSQSFCDYDMLQLFEGGDGSEMSSFLPVSFFWKFYLTVQYFQTHFYLYPSPFLAQSVKKTSWI